jgi:hypothetical protein
VTPGARPEVHTLVRQGVALMVATGDAGRRPALARGWGPELRDDGACLAVCVEAPQASPTDANLVVGAWAAVMFSLPSTYAAVQVKGRVLARHAPTAEDLARAEAHLTAFTAEVEPLGLTDIRRFFDPSLVAVVVEVAEQFDQTPGPGAGGAL